MSKRWILPVLIVVAWLVAGGVFGPSAGKLSTVQQNDNSAYLPRTAEATRGLDVLKKFQTDETLPATVVFVRNGGLTRADKQHIDQVAKQLDAVVGVAGDRVGDRVLSKDGEAAQVVVNLDSTDGDQLQESVKQIREITAESPDGLSVKVGGVGGVLGDFIKAFGAIDGVLLGVTVLVVTLILLVVYRSPLLPLLVIMSSLMALAMAAALAYAAAKNNVLDVSGQTQGILFILAIGAATDYSLLIVSRFREELRDRESKYDAMRAAYKGSFEPILASGMTVILGLLCLLLSDLSSLSGLGPVGALGVAAAMLSTLTLLPALLLIFGRAAFWPFRPKYGSPHTDSAGLWGRLARLIRKRARLVWALTFAGLLLAAANIVTLNEEQVPQTDLFLTKVESVEAQDLIDKHFTADVSSPAQIIVPEMYAYQVADQVSKIDGVAKSDDPKKPSVFWIPESAKNPMVPKSIDGQSVLFATLDAPADSAAAEATVKRIRAELGSGTDVLVTGSTAIQVDVRDTTDRDRAKVIPSILIVIFIVLALLLRSLVAPVILLVANVLSFAATMGISAFVFNHIAKFPGTDPSTPLIGFVFLVALGIDYSIFLMTRVREETIRQGTHPGILKGLSVTGGVITSAGVVLAATFAALGVLPILFLAQIAFIVAFGVLLDALIVRSLLVPALSYDIGKAIWWPSRLSREPDHADAETAAMLAGGKRKA